VALSGEKIVTVHAHRHFRQLLPQHYIANHAGLRVANEITLHGGLNNHAFGDTLFICNNDSVIWDTKLRDGYSFQWQDGSTENFFVLKDAGRYWVEVADSFNCSVTSDTVAVIIDYYSQEATLGNDTVLCSGNFIGLVNKAEETVSYLWSDGSTLPALTLFQTGDYSITAQNKHGCIMEDTLHAVISGVAPNTLFDFSKTCLNDSTHFTDLTTPANIIEWLWEFGDGTSAYVQNPAHRYSSAGDYTVTLTVKDLQGCYQRYSDSVSILPLPVANFNVPAGLCEKIAFQFEDKTATVIQDSVVSWRWNFGD